MRYPLIRDCVVCISVICGDLGRGAKPPQNQSYPPKKGLFISPSTFIYLREHIHSIRANYIIIVI
jgi:hypothetical protein